MGNSEEKNIDVKDTMQDRAYKVIKKCKEIYRPLMRRRVMGKMITDCTYPLDL